jgi:hypothetical protein
MGSIRDWDTNSYLCSQKIPHPFIETEAYLFCSQVPVIDSYSKPSQSSSQPHILDFCYTFI